MTMLRGITWEHPRGYDCVVAASDRYAESHPETTVRWDYRSLQEFGEAPLVDLARDHDLLVIDHPHISVAASSGVLDPFDGRGRDAELETLRRESVGPSHRSYSFENHQWALAIDAAAQVSASRPDLLAEPPRDWEGAIRLARTGQVLWAAKPIDAFSSLISVAGAHGWTLDAASHPFLPPGDLASALAILHELADHVPKECFDANPIDVAESLATTDRWSYSPLVFGYSNYSRPGFRSHLVTYADAPTGPAGSRGALLGGAGIAVSASSAHTREARDVALWIANAQSQAGVYFDAGGQPANAVAWDDDRIDTVSNGFFRSTRATLETASVRPQYGRWIEFQDRVSPWVTRVLRRDLGDSDFVDQWERASVELLGDDAELLGHDALAPRISS